MDSLIVTVCLGKQWCFFNDFPSTTPKSGRRRKREPQYSFSGSMKFRSQRHTGGLCIIYNSLSRSSTRQRISVTLITSARRALLEIKFSHFYCNGARP